LRVIRAGYLEAIFGAERGDGRIVLRPGAWVNEVRIEMRRPCVLAGRVHDERGEPVGGVWVRPARMIDLFGGRQVVLGEPGLTDDQGRYRLSGLEPGQYLVYVPTTAISTSEESSVRDLTVPVGISGLFRRRLPVPPATVDGQRRAYAPAAAPRIGAGGASETVALDYGEERDGIDIVLDALPAFVVAGRLSGTADSFAGLEVRLVPRGLESFGPTAASAVVRVAGDGRFAVCCLPAGGYDLTVGHVRGFLTLDRNLLQPSFADIESLSATAAPEYGVRGVDLHTGPPGVAFMSVLAGGAMPRLWARESLFISADATDLLIPLRPTARMRGRVRVDLDDRFPRPGLPPALVLFLDPVASTPEAGSPSASIEHPQNREGEFSMSGIMPGRFRLRADNGWLIKSVTWDGTDYSHRPFDADESSSFDGVDVVVTNAGAALTGRARSESSAAPLDGVVVMFPQDETAWEIVGWRSPAVRTSATTREGEFEISGLPAGDYAIAVVPVPERPDNPGPNLFRSLLPHATRVRLDWGERRTVDVIVRGGRP
jgi:hypothetical protein